MAMPLPILAPSVLLGFRLFSIWFQVSWRFATTSSTFDAMGNVRLECESVFNEVSKENVSGIHHLLVILRCCTNLFNWFVQVTWIYDFTVMWAMWVMWVMCLVFPFLDARWASMMNTYKDGLNQVKNGGTKIWDGVVAFWTKRTMRPSPFWSHAFFLFSKEQASAASGRNTEEARILGALQLTWTAHIFQIFWFLSVSLSENGSKAEKMPPGAQIARNRSSESYIIHLFCDVGLWYTGIPVRQIQSLQSWFTFHHISIHAVYIVG